MGHRGKNQVVCGVNGDWIQLYPTGSSELQHRASPNLKQRAVTVEGLRVVVR